MKKLSKKQLIILISALAVVLVSAIVLFLLLKGPKKDEYRIIKVYEVEGDTVVSRETIGDINAYGNMVLESGDLIKVNSGKLTLKLDDDKYVYATENTEFELIASGTKKDSKTTINLHEGEIANDIQNKLSDDSYYEINTPNSTMSVRGTVYYVSTYIGADGKRYTKVSVFDGTVETDLVDGGGIKAGGNRMVSKGNEVIIFADDDDTDYYADLREIKYEDIPADVLDILQEINESKYRFEIPENITDDKDQGEKDGPFTVTFKYKDKVFGTQKVEWGHKATEPSLKPAETGSWKFDFNTLIKDETVIIWE